MNPLVTAVTLKGLGIHVLLHVMHGKFLSHEVQWGHSQEDFKSVFEFSFGFAMHFLCDMKSQSLLLQWTGAHLLEMTFSHNEQEF